jgi:hypothetical protein
MKSIIEFIIMLVLAVIYFKFILPYYINNLNKEKNNLANEKYTTDINITKCKIQKKITNISSYSNEDILIDKINYTNNNIYIQI